MVKANVGAKKAFSLIELLVAMAIIAVLLGLVGFGISTAQRNSRDSQRRQKVADIKLVLEDYNTRKNTYPGTLPAATSTTVTVDATATGGSVTMSGPTLVLPTTTITGSTSSGTEYCYKANTAQGGYKIGALLESGSWYYSNTDNVAPTGSGLTVDTNCTRF